MKFMFVSPQSGHVTLCCSQEKEPVITSWHVVCQASKQWQFVCGWKPLMQGMKEHRSAMLCLGATTNYSCLTIETLNYGLATVTGTNMFKPDISSYAFLFTKYSSIQSGRYKISSLFPLKKNHDQQVSPLFFFLIILILRNRNGAVVRMLTSQKCGPVPYVGWVCYWSVFALLRGFFVGVFWISSRHKKKLQKTAKANALAIAPTKCWSNKFHLWRRDE